MAKHPAQLRPAHRSRSTGSLGSATIPSPLDNSNTNVASPSTSTSNMPKTLLATTNKSQDPNGLDTKSDCSSPLSEPELEHGLGEDFVAINHKRNPDPNSVSSDENQESEEKQLPSKKDKVIVHTYAKRRHSDNPTTSSSSGLLTKNPLKKNIKRVSFHDGTDDTSSTFASSVKAGLAGKNLLVRERSRDSVDIVVKGKKSNLEWPWEDDDEPPRKTTKKQKEESSSNVNKDQKASSAKDIRKNKAPNAGYQTILKLIKDARPKEDEDEFEKQESSPDNREEDEPVDNENEVTNVVEQDPPVAATIGDKATEHHPSTQVHDIVNTSDTAAGNSSHVKHYGQPPVIKGDVPKHNDADRTQAPVPVSQVSPSGSKPNQISSISNTSTDYGHPDSYSHTIMPGLATAMAAIEPIMQEMALSQSGSQISIPDAPTLTLAPTPAIQQNDQPQLITLKRLAQCKEIIDSLQHRLQVVEMERDWCWTSLYWTNQVADRLVPQNSYQFVATTFARLCGRYIDGSPLSENHQSDPSSIYTLVLDLAVSVDSISPNFHSLATCPIMESIFSRCLRVLMRDYDCLTPMKINTTTHTIAIPSANPVDFFQPPDILWTFAHIGEPILYQPLLNAIKSALWCCPDTRRGISLLILLGRLQGGQMKLGINNKAWARNIGLYLENNNCKLPSNGNVDFGFGKVDEQEIKGALNFVRQTRIQEELKKKQERKEMYEIEPAHRGGKRRSNESTAGINSSEHEKKRGRTSRH
ncbi:uncharacterized protein L201_004266 [Kwoniella dendrophila CBS 6074]|uniref:Uncharacterized protein n=1 Tax=Kwoniella dendrophila CBS 6074 TaxID=1295534 RepID=A0AAX4JWS3_9TREE